MLQRDRPAQPTGFRRDSTRLRTHLAPACSADSDTISRTAVTSLTDASRRRAGPPQRRLELPRGRRDPDIASPAIPIVSAVPKPGSGRKYVARSPSAFPTTTSTSPSRSTSPLAIAAFPPEFEKPRVFVSAPAKAGEVFVPVFS